MRVDARRFLREESVLLTMLALASVAVILLFFIPGGVRVGLPSPLPASAPTRIQWVEAPSVAGSASARMPAKLAEILDPSLMSLPNAHGFSRQMLNRKVPAAPRSLGWQNDAAYLGTTPGGQFPALLKQPSIATFVQNAAVPALSVPPDGDDAGGELPAAVNQSVVRALGALASQVIVRSPALPTVASETPVRPTRVRIGVAADGTIRFAALERASGNDAADARAVELARQIRFEPLAGVAPETLTWDVLRFLWATTVGD